MPQPDKENIKYGKKFIGFFLKYQILQTNFRLVIASIFLLSALHLGLALWMYSEGRSLLDLRLQINNLCFASPCDLKFRITERYNGPIHIYMAYDSFHLNHRKIINSIDVKQLEGQQVTAEDIKTTCAGFETIKDARVFFPKRFANWTDGDMLNPCGLLPLMFTECGIIRQPYSYSSVRRRDIHPA